MITMHHLWKNAELFCLTVPKSWISVLVIVSFRLGLLVTVAIIMKKWDFGE
jgi:hypothetical protein